MKLFNLYTFQECNLGHGYAAILFKRSDFNHRWYLNLNVRQTVITSTQTPHTHTQTHRAISYRLHSIIKTNVELMLGQEQLKQTPHTDNKQTAADLSVCTSFSSYMNESHPSHTCTCQNIRVCVAFKCKWVEGVVESGWRRSHIWRIM